MFGKLSGILLFTGYLIILTVLVNRDKIMLRAATWLYKFNVSSDFINTKLGIYLLIFFAALSIVAVLASIILGHYSNSIAEGHGGWLSVSLVFGYLYFAILLVIVILFKTFDMSGIR